ncbi:cobyric acid synthase [Acidimicrobiia bacterium EGI L10123]|uniref:cobyric acid synthase n=1 Tax=Salinilacustrithrix flava TaxID=2957203 RepID=UPI003D7C1B55|nr:cobyric acid synthase [Acidimicrobiia bacterium EGI L10123]
MGASPRGALLVVGATSGAGKSTVTAGLCRWFARTGATVAPFKAQNMSNHSAVSVDGGEVGRAQAMQAAAAGVDVESAMNPILLKPSSATGSHVVVLGTEVGTTDAAGWGARTDELRPVVLDALTSLRRRFDVVVAEGAGGAAEINLLDRDLVNLPLARAAGMPAVLVVDIERGGAFAAAHGTIGLLPPHLAGCIGGIVLNRFRGDPALLGDGLADLEARTGVPVLGVLPHLGPGALLGTEDSLDVGTVVDPERTGSDDPVRVAAVHLPHLANPSDLDPLVAEPDVVVRWVRRPGELADADLVVVPGSRATVDDLAWLRRTGMAAALVAAAGRGTDVVGICAGQQVLGTRITDEVESGAGTVDGLGLLEVETVFERDKVVRRRTGRTVDGHAQVAGYQIHLGRAWGDGPWLALDPVDPGGPAEREGSRSADGRVRGTSLHGLFDADGVRAGLSDVAERRGRTFAPHPVPFADRLEAQHDRMADWIGEHLDTAAVSDLTAGAAAPGSEPGW